MDLKYLTKEKTKPYKKEFIKKAHEIRDEVKTDFSICFALVGSSKRNMILIGENNSNSSFDFDYQLLINKEKNDMTPQEIKCCFIKLFKKKFKENKGWKIKDSTSAITITNDKLKYSYDVVIIKLNSQTLDANILKRNESQYYGWEEIRKYRKHKENLKQIKGSKQWSELREIYKSKKEKDQDTKSYLLFMASVHEFMQNPNN